MCMSEWVEAALGSMVPSAFLARHGQLPGYRDMSWLVWLCKSAAVHVLYTQSLHAHTHTHTIAHTNTCTHAHTRTHTHTRTHRYAHIINQLTWMTHAHNLRRVSEDYCIDLYLRPPNIGSFKLMVSFQGQGSKGRECFVLCDLSKWH